MDLRNAVNAVSDVVNNRPRPLREFDQIFMKTADMLLQAEHISRKFDKKRVIFVGDGDAIGLCLMHLQRLKILTQGPRYVHILDFDERMVNSVRQFAARFNLKSQITAELYNVADALPKKHWQKFEGFYTNPPFGASNDGKSIEAFVRRGIEAVGVDAVGCIVIADHPGSDWSKRVLAETQKTILEENFFVSELVPEFHKYHLDDTPELTSCSLVIERCKVKLPTAKSAPLPKEMLEHFYGQKAPLEVHYVRDLTNGGKIGQKSDYTMEPFSFNSK